MPRSHRATAFQHAPPFRIGLGGTEITTGGDKCAALLSQAGAIHCRQALTPEALAAIAAMLNRASFEDNVVTDIGHRQTEQPAMIGSWFAQALSRSNMLQWVRQASGRRDIDRCEGLLVKSRPGGQDHLDWHSDAHHDRPVGITVHFSPAPPNGGAFELRKIGSTQPLFTCASASAGDIVIFSVGSDLEHRVLPIAAGPPRIVWTGWFLT